MRYAKAEFAVYTFLLKGFVQKGFRKQKNNAIKSNE